MLFMEISMSTSTYFLAFSRLLRPGIQIIHSISDILDIYSVRIDGCLVVAYLERSISTFSQFFQLFFLFCKFYKLAL